MPSGSKTPKPPPDYFSRRVQLRLLVAVASLLLVISLMFEARKAENWQWMWNGVPQTEAAPEDFDTSLPERETGDPAGTVYASPQIDPATIIPQASGTDRQDALHRLELDAWRKVFDRLPRTDRTALDRVLLAARAPNDQAEGIEPSWGDSLDAIAQAFTLYLNGANEAVMLSADSLADSQKEGLLNALGDLEVGWSRELLPALQAPAESRPWTQPERDRLGALQLRLDELAVMAIHDDSFWRPAEQDAWFRWFEKLQRTDPDQLQRDSIGDVGFLQMFKQSDEYRGKLVTIHGSARLAYRVQAPRNIHGIESYVVYWVKPDGGPNSPIVVYALETPAGFPEVKDKDLDRSTTELREDVAFTGYFFKRWAYPGQGGLQTAPLLLARGPVWTADPTQGQDRPLPKLAVAVASVAGVLALSICLAVLAYRAGKNPVGEGTSLRKADRDELEALKQREVLPSPEEALRNLAAADRETTRE